MNRKEILAFFFGGAITILGTILTFALLNFLRDTSSGGHLYTMEAGWAIYAGYMIVTGIIERSRIGESPKTSRKIAFGPGAILTVPAVAFIGLH